AMQRIFKRGVWEKNFLFAVFLFTILFCSHTTAITIQAGECTISGIGGSAECSIVLDQAGSTGFSGYEITVGLTNPEIAEITAVKFPSWAGLNSRGKVPSDSLMLKGADGVNKIKAGDRNVLLATLTIRGDMEGESGIQVNVTRVEDESGAPAVSEGRPGKVAVKKAPETGGTTDSPMSPVTPLPGFSPVVTPPQDSQDELPSVTPWPTVTEEATTPHSEETGGGTGTGGESQPIDPLPVVVVPTPIITPLVTQDQDKTGDTVQEEVPTHSQSEVTPVQSPSPEQTNPPGTDGEGDEMPDPDRGMGALSIDSSPTGAGVFVDGELAGTTPLTISLAPGTYSILIEADDGRRWKGDITVSAGRTLALPPLVLAIPNCYTITTRSGPHGSVYPAGETTVMEGESVTVTFLPDAGYVLQNVSLDGVWVGPKDELELLRVSSDHNIEGIFSKIPSPVANFTVNTTGGRVPLAVQFLDLSSGPISSWDWNFGDGSRSDGREPVHVYTGTGNYSVSLKVCGNGGCDEITRDSLLQVLPEEPLEAEFTANVTCGRAPLHVLFHDVSTGTVESRSWEFGDGSSATGADPLHVYSGAGVYNVSLTIRRGDRSDTVEKPGFIEVAPLEIGGSTGYIRIVGNVDGAKVYFDADFKGTLSNGVLVVPVYITATPYRMINVRAEGYIPYSTPITRYPGEGDTIDYTVTLEPYFRGGISFNRSVGNSSVLNLTTGRPALYPDTRASE
ncbi:MAG: PKD domain-containing protein, partial [Methanolinea sp.]|nr:PKD domain-containing protein [Methanolinea sp.]